MYRFRKSVHPGAWYMIDVGGNSAARSNGRGESLAGVGDGCCMTVLVWVLASVRVSVRIAVVVTVTGILSRCSWPSRGGSGGLAGGTL